MSQTMDAPDTANDALEVARLAMLAPLEYERVREVVARALGCLVSVLDEQVKAARPQAEAATGRAITLRAVEAWHDPVNLAELLDDITRAISRHVILPPGGATALALWCAHTWVYERFEHTPRLAIRSPTKRCGKSTLLEVVEALSHWPLQSGSISASGAFRIVEAMKPLTLLLDETDTFLNDKEELRGVLNSGFQLSGYVVRVVEIDGEQQPVQFSTFAPVAFAGIGALPDTLEDRSVPIVLQRKGMGEKVTRMRPSGARATLAELAAKLGRWAKDDGSRLDPDPAMPAALNDREQDISVPLLAIADQAGSVWGERGRQALLAVFGRRGAEGAAMETGAMLLADIRDLLNENGAMVLPSAEIAEKLGKMEERPWPEWRHGKPISVNQLAAALKPFGVRPANLRRADAVVKGYRREMFDDAWTRYLPEPGAST